MQPMLTELVISQLPDTHVPTGEHSATNADRVGGISVTRHPRSYWGMAVQPMLAELVVSQLPDTHVPTGERSATNADRVGDISVT